MLFRTSQFILPNGFLFLVLPRPCGQSVYLHKFHAAIILNTSSHYIYLYTYLVTNSRYMTVERLNEIMKSIGFVCEQSNESKKLALFLYRFSPIPTPAVFKKEVPSCNNSKRPYLRIRNYIVYLSCFCILGNQSRTRAE